MKTALLVIDVQKLYTDVETDYTVKNANNIIDNINTVIETAYGKLYEIVYIKHIHAKDGSDSGRMFDYLGESDEIEFLENTNDVEYSEKLRIVPNATHLIKHRYDSFVGTGLQDFLVSKGIEKVIIVGFMTNFCCESTARTAHDLDYFVDFIKDATGTPGTENVDADTLISATCATLESGFANVITTSEFIK